MRHGVEVALIADIESGDAALFDQFYNDLPKKGFDGRGCIMVFEEGASHYSISSP